MDYAATGAGERGYLIAEMPDLERPRERLLAHGGGSLSDAELLAILLRTGRAGRSALDVARDVLVRFDGRLDKLAEAGPGELQSVRGIGRAKAVEICAALTLARRLRVADRLNLPRISGPLSIVDYMRDRFGSRTQEEFHVLLLDTKNRLLRDELVTVGLVDRTQVHAREVFRRAIQESCSRVALVHNHPSGDPTPSAHDLACTASLVAAGKVVGIEVIDHVVVGQASPERPAGYVSLKEQNLLTG